MFSLKYPNKRLNKITANIIFLIILVYYLSFVLSTEASQSRGKNLKLNETIRSTSVRSSDRRKSDSNDAVAAAAATAGPTATTTTTSGRQEQQLDLNTTLKRQYFSPNEQDKDDYRVPFWNIAHMINRIDEIEPAIRAGANGIETDISFDAKGEAVETFHGFPCDCGRHCYSKERFVKFIQHVGDITAPPSTSSLQLVVLDLKLKDLNANQKQVAGNHLAATIDEYVYRKYLSTLKSFKGQKDKQNLIIQPPVRFIISINHVHDNVLIRSFLDYMLKNRLEFMSKHVGFDVGMNDNLTDISSMWDNFNGITMNIWQGDGLTNCANIIRGVERLKEAISIRNGQGHFRKIYYWTVDVMYLIRSVLRFGLDAMLTNQPQRVVQVLQEPEFNLKYRLATPYDDPFNQFWIKPTAWSISVPTLGEAVETVANIRKTGEQYVKSLPNGIAVALQKVQESIIPINKS